VIWSKTQTGWKVNNFHFVYDNGFCCQQDPVKDGEPKIKADFEQLHEDIQQAFRNLED
jgi:uncharacterized GH25 family protein